MPKTAKKKIDGRTTRTANRPEKVVDWGLIDELLEASCDGTQIAPFFDIHPDTLYRKVEEKYKMTFTAYQQQKRSRGDAKLLTAQYNKALGGDNTMLVWTGKQRLKQKENPDSNTDIKILENFDSLMSLLAKRQQEHSEESNAKESKPNTDRID